MGKKKGKKDQKGKGAEKTAMKTERKAEKKTKKMLQEKGEEDIEALLAEFQEKDRKQGQVVETKCPPPSPRSNMTVTVHPDKDELIMFGGEFFNGSRTFLYNDLFFYNLKNQEWTQVKAPGAPPPRCAHQAVALRQGGGQLWIFGGEFASPTQSQFYHYKDLWVFHFKENCWERVSASGGPSSRSGHRIVACKKQLILFGGFHDNIRNYKYFNDVYAFNMETYTWTRIEPSGIPPSPRSGCIMAPTQDQNHIVVYGGYSKVTLKKDVDQGKTHTDMFVLSPESKNKQDASPTKWKWTVLKQSGVKPPPRSGCSLAVTPGNRAIVFGGVYDEEEDEESMTSVFYNEMYSLELDKGKWHEVFLRGDRDEKQKKARRRKKEKPSGEESGEVAMEEGEDEEEEDDQDNSEDSEGFSDDDVEENVKKLKVDDGGESRSEAQTETPPSDGPNASSPPAESQPPQSVVEDGIFTVTMGPQDGASGSEPSSVKTATAAFRGDVFVPRSRMNAQMVVHHGILYLYGGIYEDGDRQVTLSDMYSLDLHKLDKWNTIVACDEKDQEWIESDSSSGEEDEEEEKEGKQKASGEKGATGGAEEEEKEEDESEDDDSEDEMDVEDAPVVTPGESEEDYFTRSTEYWLSKAESLAKEEGLSTVSDKQLKKAAKKMAAEFYQQSS